MASERWSIIVTSEQRRVLVTAVALLASHFEDGDFADLDADAVNGASEAINAARPSTPVEEERDG